LHTPSVSQIVPFAAKLFAGHDALLPSQISCTSQDPVAERQTVPVSNASVGHAGEVPVQVSWMSQPPAAAALQTDPAVV
jgi:hypothetical protein